MSGAIRAFVAVPLPEAHADALDRLMATCPAPRPVPPENLHLTLAFLGDRAEATLEEVHYGLEAIAVPDAVLTVAGLGTFGRRAVTNLHAVVAPDPGLSRLRDRVRGAARAAGVDLPRERFRPHVTLARPNGLTDPDGLARLRDWLARHGALRLAPVPVHEITLFRSTLTSAGAVYDALASYTVA